MLFGLSISDIISNIIDIIPVNTRTNLFDADLSTVHVLDEEFHIIVLAVLQNNHGVPAGVRDG